MKKHMIKFLVFVLTLVSFGVAGDYFLPAAEARVGRPLTPVSGAGVARRTTRRVVRRGAVIGVLPAGCVLQSPYYYCGGVYYQPMVQNNTTVYVTVYLD